MSLGTMSCGELCQPAPSRISRAMALTLTHRLISAEVLVHGVDAARWHDQGGAGAAPGGDGAEQVRPGEPPVALDPRARAAPGPDGRGQRALLADAGFILKPDFNWPAGKLRRDRGACQLGKVFLKLPAPRGRFADEARAPRCRRVASACSNLPTWRSCMRMPRARR